MFGYIKPLQPQLRVCELDLYKAVYCGLCRVLSQEYSIAARFSLSYDFTFVAMLHASLQDKQPNVLLKTCPFNPLKKRPHVDMDASLAFAADLAMLLLHAKVEDNVNDSNMFASVGWRSLTLVTQHAANKAAMRLPLAKAAVDELNRAQWACEHSLDSTLDMACDPTAQVLSTVFAMMSEDEDTQRILSRLGYMLGRYCYLCDAIDDYTQDEASGNFNPLKVDPRTERIREIINLTIAEACNAYALLEPKWYKEILDNIMYLGLTATADTLINGRAIHERPI